jgi:DNA primase
MEIREEGIREKMILTVIESVLGKSKHTARNNVAVQCPFCHHSKLKLEIQIHTNEKKENPWHCWVCGEKGKTLISLFKKIKAPSHRIQELNTLIKPGSKVIEVNQTISLPKEFIPLHNIESLDSITSIEAKHAIKFLKKRKITEIDILKYNIGFCPDGPYDHRIVIPSYDADGNLNYFSTRTYRDDEPKKYINPAIGRNIIGWEYYINWNTPLILVEGIFDALTIKRNVIPLFGKDISETLMKKIVSSQVQKIYIALDNDALKQAIKHCEKLLSYGKEVYLVELGGKDANEIGFENFLNTIEQTQPLTFSTLINKKLELI